MPLPVNVPPPLDSSWQIKLSREADVCASLEPFERKDYRDSYLQTRVRGNIAYQIQGLREKSQLNQRDFAQKIGKKQSVVSRLENTEYGKVTVQTLLDVACALDVALVVRFVSYPEFLYRSADMSKAALQPLTIYESLARIKG